jgi:hypothetical protein
MFKNLKVVAIVVAIAVIAVTLYNGVPQVLKYIEGKAVTEVENRQKTVELQVQQETSEMIIEYNHDLSKEVVDAQVHFTGVDHQLDELIQKRMANAVELPVLKVTATFPVNQKPDDKAPVEVKPQEADISELSLAWQSFCRLRPSYKDCIEGTHP